MLAVREPDVSRRASQLSHATASSTGLVYSTAYATSIHLAATPACIMCRNPCRMEAACISCLAHGEDFHV